MQRLQIKPNEAGKVLLAAAQRFQTESVLTDVQIVRNGEILTVGHKVVFAAFSYYLEQLLQGTDGLAVLNVDSISETHVKHIIPIVGFIYGHNTVVRAEEVGEFLEAAKVFGVSSVSKCLTQEVVNQASGTLITIRPAATASLLLVSLQRFRGLNQFIDAKVSFDNGVSFSCHKLVLAAFSTYLETLLQSTETCAFLGMDQLEPIYVRQMRFIFDYMYGVPVKLDDKQVALFCDAARIFGIHSLDDGDLAKMRDKALKLQHDRMLKERIGRLRADTQSSAPSTSSSFTLNDAQIIRHAWTNAKHLHDANKRLTISRLAKKQDNQSADLETMVAESLPDIGESIIVSNDQIVDVGNVDDAPSCSSSRLIDDLPSSSNMTLNSSDGLSYTVDIDRQDIDEENDQVGLSFEEGGEGDSSEDRSVEDPDGYFVCSDCGCIVNSLPALRHHQTSLHSPAKAPKASTSKKTEPSASTSPTKRAPPLSYPCVVRGCGKVFRSEHGLRNHRQMHQKNDTELGCNRCDYVATSKAYLNEHMKVKHGVTSSGHKVKLHKCHYCEQTFIYRSLVDKHVRTAHLKIRPYQCSHCDYCTSEKTSLDTHIRFKHTGEKPFFCSKCSGNFATASALARHKRSKHEAAALHACSLCNEQFKEKRELTVHINRDHNDERPFACDQCDHKFFRKDHLLAHKRRIHVVDCDLIDANIL
uniref:Uncharacterized protein n=1 Tax=Plectus sambesii TaxID=2011161 RepID=A0A914W134_9BILA